MCVPRSLIIIPIAYILSEYSHDGLFYRHNPTYGKLSTREIAHITDLMLANSLANRRADFFHLYQRWRIPLRDNTGGKKRSGAGMPYSSPNCRWGKSSAEKDLRRRGMWRRQRKGWIGTEKRDGWYRVCRKQWGASAGLNAGSKGG